MLYTAKFKFSLLKIGIGAMLLLFHVICGVSKPLQNTENKDFEMVYTTATTGPFSESTYLTSEKGKGNFAVIEKGKPTQILVSESDHPGVLKIAQYFRRDLSHVSGQEAELLNASPQKTQNLIIVGTAGKSEVIDQLVKNGKIDVSQLENKWEQFLITSVKDPMQGVRNALVIVGSDKRGTIYGMFDLSEKLGVSPWYWWADVPIKVRNNAYVKPGIHTLGEPKVKYRGIFINDEAPALTGWVGENYGGFNHEFYEKVFELILRMKGNYLWPAMWGRSLWDDDSLSAPLANEMGVVLATSHHEPLMRSHVEWGRYGKGSWNYEENAENLRKFWKEGMERINGYESVVTLAMRGDGDEAMSEETATDLLEKIVADQREIIEEVTGKPAEETPQVWALYKEVQDYYDKGMRVPDDVTLLLCDDNWGNVRILPSTDAKPRKGGYGMYYHFDFVGGPRSYKWLNVTQIERVWEQMHLTYEYGVDRIWLVNVGDLKPMEFPISFFLDYAWNPDQWPADKLPDYYTQWAEKQFGAEHAQEIGEIISLYTKYNARRTPELIGPDTYSLDNFREADRVVAEYKDLVERSEKVLDVLPESYKSAYYQLVQSPVELCSNLNEMHVAASKNKRYIEEGRASANLYADKVKELFFKDAALTRFYHDSISDGKWNHMMSQTHIGYKTWSDPPVNIMPEVSYIQPNMSARLGYVVENGVKSRWRRTTTNSGSFAPFDPINDQSYYLEIFNMGKEELSYSVTPKEEWINLSSSKGTVQYEEKIYVSIDWDKVPKGNHKGQLVISGAGQEFTITVPVNNEDRKASGFIENNGIISIEAQNFQNANETKDITWKTIPNLGRTSSAVTPLPVTSSKQNPGGKSPSLEYKIFVLDSGTFELTAYLSSTLNYQKDEGLLYAFSIDDSKPVIINMHKDATVADWKYPDWWNNAVTNKIMDQTVLERKLTAGSHTIKYWMVDPGVVLQKIVLKKKGVDASSYLGPPESKLLK